MIDAERLIVYDTASCFIGGHILDPGPVIKVFERGNIQQTLESSGKPGTLTVCMVVKDELRGIREAIQNFQGFADEIVVVDTGSTDGTLEALRSLPVVLIQEPWQEDFSKVRNTGLEAASSAWIMWMDADDRVTRSDFKAIRAFISAPMDRVFVFELINAPLHVSVGESFYQIRLFPNHPQLRFEGKIHEDVGESVRRLGLHRTFVRVKVHHTGYASEKERERKSERNLEMLAGVAEEEKDALFLSREGDAHAMAKHWDKAAESYEASLAHPSCAERYPVLYKHLPTLIGRVYQSACDWEKALKWFQQSILSYEDKVDAYAYAAEVHEQLGEEDMAEEAWLFVLQAPKLSHDVVGDQGPLIRMYSYDGLCRLYTKQKRWKELHKLATVFLQECRELVEPRWHLGRALLELGQREDAVLTLERGMNMYPRPAKEVWDLLFRAYEELGDEERLDQLKRRYALLCS